MKSLLIGMLLLSSFSTFALEEETITITKTKDTCFVHFSPCLEPATEEAADKIIELREMYKGRDAELTCLAKRWKKTYFSIRNCKEV